MKTTIKLLLAILLVPIMINTAVRAQDDATELMKKSHLAFYYAGDDGLAEVNMTIVDKRGKEREKEFTMLRKDITDGGNQLYYTYFKKPSDVSRLTFMVHKTPDGSDARWIYVPAVDLIKPISADDKNSSFVGSDFSYEDVSGRHWSEDNHKIVGDSTVNGRPVTVVESTPKDEGYKGFAKKISYIDKENLLPLLERYYDQKGDEIREFTADKIEDVDGITTVTKRTMIDLKKDRHTTITFVNIKYNIGLTEDIFTERYLKNPPREFIK